MSSSSSFDVAIVGLGYVGLTLATALADVGLRVLGIEKRAAVLYAVRSGRAHFQENGLDSILERVVGSGRLEVRESFEADDRVPIAIITVGTPLGADGKARLDMIEEASAAVAAAMTDGALVILRSTVKIGTSRNVVAPVLAASGKRFLLAMCPERTLEGKAMEELRQLPQIVGADDDDARAAASALFSRLTPTVLPVSSLETAETIKLADNTYRDSRFAFANEIARLCDAVGVSAREVIETGKNGYSRTDIALPGLVGGPCLEKDPHILRQSALAHGIDLEIAAASRLVNERQPREGAEFVAGELTRRGFPEDAPIALLGLAFKGRPETDDLRGSMALKVLSELRLLRPKAEIRLHDPIVSQAGLDEYQPGERLSGSLDEVLSGAAAAVITNNHAAYSEAGLDGLAQPLAERGFVYDFWNHHLPRGGETEPSYFALGSAKRRTS